MKKIIYIDMDDVLCDYKKAHSQALLENPKIQFPQSQFGFFRSLKPISGGLEAVKYLNDQLQFDVYILTAPSTKNPLCYLEKRLWVEDYLGMEMVERLIISPNKGLNKGDYLIDDNDSGRGQDQFEGKLIKFGSGEFEAWTQVLEYLVGP